MKIIKGDLVLEKDTIFNESIKVEGNIRGRFNLKVEGDIDAGDINARDIVCEKRTKKSKISKTKARIFIQDKSKLERKYWD